jgi:RNA polymerase subunit RPABC4/transcription elongation factor Spt4
MEITCNRCHRTVQTEDCYCPACGLPQLVYSAEDAATQSQPERWNEPVRDAATIAWKPALRVVMMLAIPAGLLCSAFSPVGVLGLFWMSAAAAWAVLLYVRSQQAPWITLGAGARIGLVTGILGGWIAAATTGITLVVMRFLLHQGGDIDGFWQTTVNEQMLHQTAAGVDAQSVAIVKGWLLSPEGRAGFALGGILCLCSVLLFFAVAGGALGARLTARTRRP